MEFMPPGQPADGMDHNPIYRVHWSASDDPSWFDPDAQQRIFGGQVEDVIAYTKTRVRGFMSWNVCVETVRRHNGRASIHLDEIASGQATDT